MTLLSIKNSEESDMQRNSLKRLKYKLKKMAVIIGYFLAEKKEKPHIHFTKKAGLTIIGLGIGIFAYKKFTHKK